MLLISYKIKWQFAGKYLKIFISCTSFFILCTIWEKFCCQIDQHMHLSKNTLLHFLGTTALWKEGYIIDYKTSKEKIGNALCHHFSLWEAYWKCFYKVFWRPAKTNFTKLKLERNQNVKKFGIKYIGYTSRRHWFVSHKF